MEPLEALGLVATALTVIGGLVGLLLTVRSYRLSRRALTVRITEEVRSLQAAEGLLRRRVAREQQFVTITAHNPGTAHVPISSACLQVDGRRVSLDAATEGHFPLDLGGGKSYTLPVNASSLAGASGASGTVRVRAVFRDALGKEHRSRPARMQL